VSKLTFELKPSRYLAMLFMVMYGGATVILIQLALPTWVKIILVYWCCGSFICQLYQQVWRNHPNAIVKFWKTESGEWFLQNNKQQVWTATLCADSVCTLYFVLLNFKSTHTKKRCSVVILPDSLDSVCFRHLQIFFNN
jgi:hypothetical protein